MPRSGDLVIAGTRSAGQDRQRTLATDFTDGTEPRRPMRIAALAAIGPTTRQGAASSPVEVVLSGTSDHGPAIHRGNTVHQDSPAPQGRKRSRQVPLHECSAVFQPRCCRDLGEQGCSGPCEGGPRRGWSGKRKASHGFPWLACQNETGGCPTSPRESASRRTSDRRRPAPRGRRKSRWRSSWSGWSWSRRSRPRATRRGW